MERRRQGDQEKGQGTCAHAHRRVRQSGTEWDREGQRGTECGSCYTAEAKEQQSVRKIVEAITAANPRRRHRQSRFEISLLNRNPDSRSSIASGFQILYRFLSPFPAMTPVGCPSATAAFPFTKTHLIPTLSFVGSTYVASSRTVFGSKTMTSA